MAKAAGKGDKYAPHAVRGSSHTACTTYSAALRHKIKRVDSRP